MGKLAIDCRSRVRGLVDGPYAHVAFLLSCVVSFSSQSYLHIIQSTYIIILMQTILINVTAACVRGCAASVGSLVTGKEKGENKRGQQTVKVPN